MSTFSKHVINTQRVVIVSAAASDMILSGAARYCSVLLIEVLQRVTYPGTAARYSSVLRSE